MSLSRKFLSAMGIEADKVDEIIEAHAETINAIKAERDGYKDSASKITAVQKQLDEANEELKNLRDQNAEDWKSKYEKEHSDFETFKDTQDKKSQREAKATAYREVLKSAGVSEKRFNSILKLTDLDSLGMNKNGELKDVDKLTENIKSEWADFIVKQETEGTQIEQPPKIDPNASLVTKEQIMAIKDRTERRKAIQNNPQLFK